MTRWQQTPPSSRLLLHLGALFLILVGRSQLTCTVGQSAASTEAARSWSLIQSPYEAHTCTPVSTASVSVEAAVSCRCPPLA